MLASCSKDDVYQVSGNKYAVSYAKLTISTISIELKTPADLEEYGFNWVLEFKTDKNLYMENEKVGTWSQSDNTVTIKIDEDTFSGNVTENEISASASYTDPETNLSGKVELKLKKQ